jgi:hypothetical protein
MASFPQQTGWSGSAPAATVPGANAPNAVAPQGVQQPVTANGMFGSPGASTSGAAGKMPITSGPQLTGGAKAGTNLKSNDSTLASNGLLTGAGKGGSTQPL